MGSGITIEPPTFLAIAFKSSFIVPRFLISALREFFWSSGLMMAIGW